MKYILLGFFFTSFFVLPVCDKDFVFFENIAFDKNLQIIDGQSYLIRDLNSNGKIFLNEKTSDGKLQINMNNNLQFELGEKDKNSIVEFGDPNINFSILNLPFIVGSDIQYFLCIDSNNKVYLINYENYIFILQKIKSRRASKNELMSTADGSLFGNISVNSINSNTDPVFFHSTNKNGDSIDIVMGNNNNNFIIKSNMICNINAMKFNNTINSPIISDLDFIINNSLIAQSIDTDSFIYPSQNTINFNNIFIAGNLKNQVDSGDITVQGDISWNGAVKLGNSSNTSFSFYIKGGIDNNIENLLLLDQNNNLWRTTDYPSISKLLINECISNSDITIISENKKINQSEIGNSTGFIKFDAPKIFFNNNVNTPQDSIIGIDDILYIINGNVRQMNKVDNIICNQLVDINSATITFENMLVNNNIYFNDLPIIDNPVGNVALILLDDTGSRSVLVAIKYSSMLYDEKRIKQINNFKSALYSMNIKLSEITKKYIQSVERIKERWKKLQTLEKKFKYFQFKIEGNK